MTVISNNINIS